MKRLLFLILIVLIAGQVQANFFIRDSVKAGADDCDSTDDGFENAGDFMEMGFYPLFSEVRHNASVRFSDVQVDPSATIVSAYIEFYCVQSSISDIKMTIGAIAADNQAALTQASDFELTQTSAQVNWNLTENWTVNNWFRSADIGTVIQEMVDDGDWDLGDAIVLLLLENGGDNGTRQIFRSYEANASPVESAKLIVEVASDQFGEIRIEGAAGDNAIAEDTILFSEYTCNTTGTADSIYVRLRSHGGGSTVEWNVVIYEGNTLIDSSTPRELANDANPVWAGFELLLNGAVADGTEYELGVRNEGGAVLDVVMWIAETDSTYDKDAFDYSTPWPAGGLTSDASVSDAQLIIYCTVIPAGGLSIDISGPDKCRQIGGPDGGVSPITKE